MGLTTAVILALVGTFAIVAYVSGAEHRAQAGEQLVKVLVVKENVPAGTPAKELGDRIGLEKISRKVMADGAVTNVRTLGDKVAGTTLVKGEQVIDTRFVAPSQYSATGADVQVPPGLLRTTVALDPAQVIGGVLTPGAKVAVAASFDKDADLPAETHILFHQVLVTNVQLTGTVNSNENTSSQNTADTAKPGEAPTSQLLVTLALDGASVERLVYAEQFGHVSLSIEPSDASQNGLKVVTRENVFQ
jgi:pilus assembly protein CpaB